MSPDQTLYLSFQSKFEVDDVQVAHFPGHLGSVQEGDVGRQEAEDHDERRHHTQRDDPHLQKMCLVDGIGPARRGVESHQSAYHQDRQADIPPHEDGDDQRRGEDCEAAGQAPLSQEEETSQRAVLDIETLFKEFVGRIHLQPVEMWNGGDGEDHHGDRKPQIELHESHSVHVGLAGSGEKSDGTGLGGHDREGDRVPGCGPVRQDVAIDIFFPARFPDTEDDHEYESGGHHNPVDSTHGLGRVWCIELVATCGRRIAAICCALRKSCSIPPVVRLRLQIARFPKNPTSQTTLRKIPRHETWCRRAS